MVNEGWPPGENLYNHAAYLLLQYQADKAEYLADKFSTFKNRVKLREQTGTAYLKGTSSDPRIQTYGSTLALRHEASDARLNTAEAPVRLTEASSRVSLVQRRSVFGERLPARIQL